jgi:hypothetical protein
MNCAGLVSADICETCQRITLPRIELNVPHDMIVIGDFPSGRHVHGLVPIASNTIALHFVTMQCGDHEVAFVA